MGQYFKPISIDKNEFLNSHDYGNGLKLMEHSWIGNNFVETVMNLIKKGGAWHGDKIVWAGDYADEEPGKEDKEERTLYMIAREEGTQITPKFTPEKDLIFSSKLGCYLSLDNKIQIKKEDIAEELRYIKNLDTKEYIDLKKVLAVKYHWTDEPLQIHPLPLLTCEGNGRGGGDYRKDEDNKLIGLWSRNRIVAQKSKPKNCTELKFDLTE